MKQRRRNPNAHRSEQRLALTLAGLAFIPGLISVPGHAQSNDWVCLPAANGIDWVCRSKEGIVTSTAQDGNTATAPVAERTATPEPRPAPEDTVLQETANAEPADGPKAKEPEAVEAPAEPIAKPTPVAVEARPAEQVLAVETRNERPEPPKQAEPTKATESAPEPMTEKPVTAVTPPPTVDAPVVVQNAEPEKPAKPQPEPVEVAVETTPASIADDEAVPLPPQSGEESYRPSGWPLPPKDENLSIIAQALSADDFGASILRAKAPNLCGVATGSSELPWNTDGKIHVSADSIETDASESGETLVIGQVVIQKGEQALVADEARINQDTQEVELQGRVRFRNPIMGVESESGQVKLVDSTGEFQQVQYYLQDRHAHGGADSVEIRNENEVALNQGSYTTCLPGANQWSLNADSIELNRATGRGEARNTTLRMGDLPVFYFPYINFPIDDRRQTGFLVPSIGSSDKHGFAYHQPIYWNIAPNYDLTTTPGILEKRGFVMENEFRYLMNGGHEGNVVLNVLPDDQIYGKERYLAGWSHLFRPNEFWKTEVNLQGASDQQYLEDFGSGLVDTSSSHLHRYVSVTRDNLHSHLSIRLDDYQIMDNTVTSSPYQVLPRLTYARNFHFPQQTMAAEFNVDLASFNRDSRVHGWRLNSQPEVRWPMRTSWGGLEPKVKVDLTRYELDNQTTGTSSSPSRALPMLRVDGDLVFEKPMEFWGAGFTHTIEPRAMYLYVPRKNQSAFPIFDTNGLTPSYTGLFYDNRFAGGDRIGDTNQLSLGISSRLLDDDSGAEAMRADLGVAYYFEDRIEQLTGTATQTSNTSEYVGRIRSQLGNHWYTELEGAYDSDADNTLKSNFELGYRPNSDNLFTVQHRYLVNSTGHTMLSGSTRVNDRLKFVGAWDYSHRLNKTIDTLAGLEYETCCWATRLVARHYQTDTTGRTDNSIMFEIELKGLAGIGQSVRSTLADRIDGYDSSE